MQSNWLLNSSAWRGICSILLKIPFSLDIKPSPITILDVELDQWKKVRVLGWYHVGGSFVYQQIYSPTEDIATITSQEWFHQRILHQGKNKIAAYFASHERSVFHLEEKSMIELMPAPYVSKEKFLMLKFCDMISGRDMNPDLSTPQDYGQHNSCCILKEIFILLGLESFASWNFIPDQQARLVFSLRYFFHTDQFYHHYTMPFTRYIKEKPLYFVEGRICGDFSLVAFYKMGDEVVHFICTKQIVIPSGNRLRSVLREAGVELYSSDYKQIDWHIGWDAGIRINLFHGTYQPTPTSVLKFLTFTAVDKLQQSTNSEHLATFYSLKLYEKIMSAVLLYLGRDFLTSPKLHSQYSALFSSKNSYPSRTSTSSSSPSSSSEPSSKEEPA